MIIKRDRSVRIMSVSVCGSPERIQMIRIDHFRERCFDIKHIDPGFVRNHL